MLPHPLAAPDVLVEGRVRAVLLGVRDPPDGQLRAGRYGGLIQRPDASEVRRRLAELPGLAGPVFTGRLTANY